MIPRWITAAQDVCPFFVELAAFSDQVIKQLGYVLSLEMDAHPQY